MGRTAACRDTGFSLGSPSCVFHVTLGSMGGLRMRGGGLLPKARGRLRRIRADASQIVARAFHVTRSGVAPITERGTHFSVLRHHRAQLAIVLVATCYLGRSSPKAGRWMTNRLK